MALIDTIQTGCTSRTRSRSGERAGTTGSIGRPSSRYLRLAERQNQPSAEGAFQDSKPATSDGALNDPVPPGRANRSERLHIVYNACVSAIDAEPSESQCASSTNRSWLRLDQGLSRPADLARSGERARLRARVSQRAAFCGQILGAMTLAVARAHGVVKPGEEVQVDFGQGAFIVDGDGKRRRLHVFRIVLEPLPRKGYSEVVLRQTTDAFLMCLENAFWHFGGVLARVVLDNLKAAVLQRGLVRSGIASEDAGVFDENSRLRVSADQTVDAQTQGEGGTRRRHVL